MDSGLHHTSSLTNLVRPPPMSVRVWCMVYVLSWTSTSIGLLFTWTWPMHSTLSLGLGERLPRFESPLLVPFMGLRPLCSTLTILVMGLTQPFFLRLALGRVTLLGGLFSPCLIFVPSRPLCQLFRCASFPPLLMIPTWLGQSCFLEMLISTLFITNLPPWFFSTSKEVWGLVSSSPPGLCYPSYWNAHLGAGGYMPFNGTTYESHQDALS